MIKLINNINNIIIMATEEFKELTKMLFADYVELMTKDTKPFDVKFSFKEYLMFYIEYKKVEDNIQYFDDNEDNEDLTTE